MSDLYEGYRRAFLLPTKQDRVAGVLLGLVAGDRIGGPLHMALCLAESLIAQRGFDAEHVFDTYSTWYFDGGFDTGPIAQRVFRKVSRGKSVQAAVAQAHRETDGMTAGCNPMHRAVVLALSPHIVEESLADNAREEARLTHFHPLAGDVSAQTVILCRLLVQGVDFGTALKQLDTEDWLDRPLSNSGFSPDVFHAALHYVEGADSFKSALTPALKFAGPDNYCPVVVGALAGAIYGTNQITPDLLGHCAILNRVFKIADQFIQQEND